MIQQYIEAFTRCYPEKNVEVRPTFNKQGTQIGWRVGINGDFGNLVLSDADIREATRAFMR